MGNPYVLPAFPFYSINNTQDKKNANNVKLETIEGKMVSCSYLENKKRSLRRDPKLQKCEAAREAVKTTKKMSFLPCDAI